MSVILYLVVRSRPDTYEDLAKLLRDELRSTAKAKGLTHVSCATDPEMHEFRVWEVWEDAETCQNYVNWRTDRGDFRRMDAFVAGPYQLRQMDQLIF